MGDYRLQQSGGHNAAPLQGKETAPEARHAAHAPQSPAQRMPASPDMPEAIPELLQATIGEIVMISGTTARVLLHPRGETHGRRDAINPHVGTVLTVDTGSAIVLCLITAMSFPDTDADPELTGSRIIDVELVGELPRQQDGYICTFRRGVSVYPRLGDAVCVPTRKVLEKAYYFGSFDGVEIGRIHQDPTIPAVIKLNEMMGKHFAIVGSTGTGKSCAVALILRQFLAKQPESHIVLVDPHNEYGNCFGDQANVITLDKLCLPFWFLNFEEIVEILLGGQDGNRPEIELLRELIPDAKRQYAANRGRENRLLQRSVTRKERYSVDVPVPYRISDLLDQIKGQMGRLESHNDMRTCKRLMGRIEAVAQDPRYSFMFGQRMVDDNLGEVLKKIFRVPVSGKPITIVQLVGLPAEIINVVVSIIARLGFDLALWSEGKVPITLVCEEAHRYVPREKNVGFEPTKRIISRIAKEGRKYGIALCVVSQRPGDVDPTILSQCSTIFTMRLSNERDQQIVRSAVADAAESLLRFLPSLGMREAVAFGDGITLPSRIMLAELPQQYLPKGASAVLDETRKSEGSLVDDAVMRWRSVGCEIESLVPEAAVTSEPPTVPLYDPYAAPQPQHGHAPQPQQPARPARPPRPEFGHQFKRR